MAPTSARPARTRVLVAAAALVAGLVPALVAPSAHAAVPSTPAFGPTVDGWAQYDGQAFCSPTAKPGARKLANLLLATYGPVSIGITRPCSDGGQSEHKEGRALDWMMSMRNSVQRAKANAFLTWLLAPDANGNQAAMARRLGVMYIGWNNRMWRAYGQNPGWGDLKGCSTDPAKAATSYDTYCHRNHVHISLSWDGAAGLTSFWTGAPLPDSCRAPWDAPTSTNGDGADLVPVEPVRVLDTRRGIGLDAPCRLSASPTWDNTRGDVVVHVLGQGAVPPDGVAAVAVRVTASRLSGITPTVYARSLASSVQLPVVSIVPGTTAQGTVVVPVASDGTIRLMVNRAGSDVQADVVGYVPVAPVPPTPPAGAAPGSGTTHVSQPVLVFDGRTSLLGPRQTRTIHLGGVAGVPTSGLTGLALTMTTGTTSTVDFVGLLAPSMTTFVGSVRTSTTMPKVTQALVPTSNGDVVVRNTGSSPVAVRLFLDGWTTAAATDGGGSLVTLGTPWLAIDSAKRIGLSGAATSTAVRWATVADGTHVPVGARGILLLVGAKGGSTDGTLAVGSAGLVSAVSFLRGSANNEILLLPLSASGTLGVQTRSLGTHARIVVLGYVA